MKKIKVKAVLKPQKCIPEIHTLLDLLCETKYYGKLTFYFQNGNIEHINELSSISKAELIKRIRNIQQENNSLKNKNTMKHNYLQLVFPFYQSMKKIS